MYERVKLSRRWSRAIISPPTFFLIGCGTSACACWASHRLGTCHVGCRSCRSCGAWRTRLLDLFPLLVHEPSDEVLDVSLVLDGFQYATQEVSFVPPDASERFVTNVLEFFAARQGR